MNECKFKPGDEVMLTKEAASCYRDLRSLKGRVFTVLWNKKLPTTSFQDTLIQCKDEKYSDYMFYPDELEFAVLRPHTTSLPIDE